MRNYKSESTARPSTWDKTSSAIFVYYNYNIVEIPSIEDIPTRYQYDVAEYTNKEYIALMDDIIKENSDAICELAEIVGE